MVIFEDLLRRYNRMLRCCVGNVSGLSQHVWNPLCECSDWFDLFGIKSELLNTGTAVVECRSLRSSRYGRHMFGPIMAREAIQWRCGCVINDQKRTKANEKLNICENKCYLIGKIE